MKILFTITRAFNPNDAGVQRTTYKLGKFFSEQGHEVAYFSTKNDGHVSVDFGTLYAVSEMNGLRTKSNVVYLKAILLSFCPDIVINQMPYEKKLRNILYQYKRSCDYILIGCLRNSLFNFLSNVRLKINSAVSSRFFRIIDNRLCLALIKRLHVIKHRYDLRSILNSHDYYVLLAPQNIDELKFFVGNYKNHKVSVIPNSIPNVYPASLQKKRKNILYVGSLNVAQKRTDLLLIVWQKAQSRLPDWNLIVVGHGEYAPVLKQEIERQKVLAINLEGFKRPEQYYIEASIFIMTSAYEGFPNTILEAQSYGVPVMAFNSYAALDGIVNHSIDAILVPPFDTDQFADQLVQLASDSHQLRAMQGAALLNAERFTIDKVGKQWLKFFDSIRA